MKYCGANLAREGVDERPHEEEDDVNGEEAGDGRPQLPGDHLRLQQREGEEDLILSGTDTRDGAGDVRRVLLAGELCAQVICLGWGRRECGEHCRAKPEQKQSKMERNHFSRTTPVSPWDGKFHLNSLNLNFACQCRSNLCL